MRSLHARGAFAPGDMLPDGTAGWHNAHRAARSTADRSAARRALSVAATARRAKGVRAGRRAANPWFARGRTRMASDIRAHEPGTSARGHVTGMPTRGLHARLPRSGRPLEQRRTSGGNARNFAFATPGDGAGSDTCNLRGVMPNSPPRAFR